MWLWRHTNDPASYSYIIHYVLPYRITIDQMMSHWVWLCWLFISLPVMILSRNSHDPCALISSYPSPRSCLNSLSISMTLLGKAGPEFCSSCWCLLSEILKVKKICPLLLDPYEKLSKSTYLCAHWYMLMGQRLSFFPCCSSGSQFHCWIG